MPRMANGGRRVNPRTIAPAVVQSEPRPAFPFSNSRSRRILAPKAYTDPGLSVNSAVEMEKPGAREREPTLLIRLHQVSARRLEYCHLADYKKLYDVKRAPWGQ